MPATRSPSNPGSRLARVKVLVVGSGAREHALAWRLTQSPALTELHAAPGNPGIASLGRCHPVRADDGDGLLSLALTVEADLAVIGPEAPLVDGVADLLRQNGIAVFGPSAAAARIEGSKAFAKDVLRAAGVPTAETLSVARAPCVIKADGLASGKGVFVCHTQRRGRRRARRGRGARRGVRDRGAARRAGGVAVRPLRRAAARAGRSRAGLQADRRRRHGPEHGRHGRLLAGRRRPRRRLARRAGAPAGARRARAARHAVHRLPLRRADADAGAEGARVQRALRRPGDAGADGAAGRAIWSARWRRRRTATSAAPRSSCPATSAVTVVVAGPDYPARSDYAGAPIDGHRRGRGRPARSSSTAARRCGTARVVTNGGRILSVTALGSTVEEARDARLRGGRPRLVRGRAGATGHRGGGRWLSRSSGS